MLFYKLTLFLALTLNLNLINCDNETTTKSTTTTTTTVSTTTTSTTPSTTTTTKAASQTSSTCTLNESSSREKGLLNKVLALDKKQFKVEDLDHEYYFGVCTKANEAEKSDEAFIQVNKKSRKQVVIGRLNDVDLEGFGIESPGIRIQYKNGDRYPHVCNQAERNSVVYIICNPNNSSDLFEMIEENHDRVGDSCGYIFQLRTPLMCTNSTKCSNTILPSGKKANKLGFAAIVLLVAFTVLFIYFAVGTAYNRYVNQARGIEQLPHHEAWQNIGSRSAECCNYICRCGKRPSQIRNYEHISDQLSDDDENLLNM